MQFNIWKLRASLAIVCLGVASIAQAQVYDLTADFSTTSNPNGVWSYNLNGTPLDRVGWVDYGGGPYGGGWAWSSGSYGADGAIGRLETPGAGWWFDGQPGDIVVHTFSWGGSDSITWTSLGAGTIDISGRAWSARVYENRDSSWALSLNGQVLAERSTIRYTTRTDSAAPFANNLVAGQELSRISVAEGDVVAFIPTAVTPLGDFMGVEMTVNFTPVPEPAHAALLVGLGLVGFVGWRRTKSKTAN